MTLILRHWSADPVVLTGYVIVAVVHLRLGAYRDAQDSLDRALRIQRERQDRAGESAVLTNLGLTY